MSPRHVAGGGAGRLGERRSVRQQAWRKLVRFRLGYPPPPSLDAPRECVRHFRWVRRRVAVIATPGGDTTAPAAKAATATIPIVFGVAQDPVKLGVLSPASPARRVALGRLQVQQSFQTYRLRRRVRVCCRGLCESLVLARTTRAPACRTAVRCPTEGVSALNSRLQLPGGWSHRE
jgi:hypothetical protein